MPVDLTKFMPGPDDMLPEDIMDARRRLVAYLGNWWPDVDTQPNSPFGDLHMTPLATMIASLELAIERVMGDVDLDNVAKGKITDEAFVQRYLRNFGVIERGSVNSSGVIRLVFSENKTYSIDAESDFSVGGSVFKINSDEGNPVVIQPTDTPSARRVLNREGEGIYVVFLPVTGSPGIMVTDGSTVTSSLSYQELVSITAIGDFDSGMLPESISELAEKARKTYPSSSLSSRSGIHSFVHSIFPQLIGVSATVTGDREMIREETNPLGISEGAIDVYVKSKIRFTFAETILKLTYDTGLGGWVGRLSTPVPPAFYATKAGIFQVQMFQNNRGIKTVFSKSIHDKIDNIGVAYSRYEVLGVLIDDTQPTDFEAAVISSVEQVAGNDAILSVSGTYSGDVFHSRTARNVSLRFDSADTDDAGIAIASATVRDSLTGDNKQIVFEPNDLLNPTHGVIKKDNAYKDMLNGLELLITDSSGGFDPTLLVGNVFEFNFRGQTANFSFNYYLDPAVVQIDNITQDPDNRPAGVSIFAKSFVVCHVERMLINYRAKQGVDVDLTKARREISDYLNSLVYPEIYEDSTVSQIMRNAGASGVQSIIKRGIFYPSLANVFVQKDGTEIAVSRYESTNLMPPANDEGYGLRNVTYFLEAETITFNGSVL